MKKLLSLLLICGLGYSANAQDKKFQIGLATGGTFSWVKTQTSEIERNGIGSGFTIGVNGNYLFNENIGLALGVQFDIESFKLNYGSAITGSTPSGRVFYGFNDTEILKYDESTSTIEGLQDTSNVLELTTRKFKAKYVTIPVFLKFQTNKIGQFIYYGKFGLRTSILAGIRMDDEGYAAAFSPSASPNGDFVRTGSAIQSLNSNMKPVTTLKDLNFIRLGIGIYAGAEWNFTGNTYLFLEGGFNYGITPALHKESKHLINQVNEGPGLYEDGPLSRSILNIQNNPQHIIEIKVGILF